MCHADERMAAQHKTRGALRQSALPPSSQKLADPTALKMRYSDLTWSASKGSLITTMENADVGSIVLAVSAVIQAYVRESKPMLFTSCISELGIFDERRYPLDSSLKSLHPLHLHTVETFVRMIQIALELDELSLVIALILLERAMDSETNGLTLNAWTWRPTLLTAIIVASKVVYDEKVFLADYRDQLPGLSLDAASAQELKMLEVIRYNTSVRRGQYATYYYALEDIARSKRASF